MAASGVRMAAMLVGFAALTEPAHRALAAPPSAVVDAGTDAGAEAASRRAVTTPPSSDTASSAQGPLPTSPSEQHAQAAAPATTKRPADLNTIDYVTRRYEPAGFPTLGGDTDTGLLIGAATSLTRFGDGTRPYVWNLNVVGSVSFKNDGGFRLVQQNYIVALDVPRFEGSEVRLQPEIAYVRTIDAPYYGRGNAVNLTVPSGADATTYNEFLSQTFLLREITRIVVHKPYEIVFEPRLRYAAPSAYAGSRLAADAAANGANGEPIVHGLHDGTLVTVAAGIIVDSRDDELYPKHGVFHQAALKYTLGLPVDGDVNYGSLSGVFAWYLPLGGESVLALRGVADFDVGNVPFYDLYTGGPFRVTQLPGGSTGVRGVPLGLYSGLIKIAGNVEARDLFAAFRVGHQKIRLGGDVFFDAGRAFDDYSFHSPRDGSGVGIHWGTGAGLYVVWGDAALIRFEAAYSPDAFDLTIPFTHVGVPLGFYVQDGVMF